MRKISFALMVMVFLVPLSLTAHAQNNDQVLVLGLSGGGSLGENESDEQDFQPHVRASLGTLRHEQFQSELGVGYTLNGAEDYETMLIPIDVRLSFSPVQ